MMIFIHKSSSFIIIFYPIDKDRFSTVIEAYDSEIADFKSQTTNRSNVFP